MDPAASGSDGGDLVVTSSPAAADVRGGGTWTRTGTPVPEHRRLLTPSKITAWLDCPHYLNLKHRPDGRDGRSGSTLGSFAELLMRKGLEHEVAVEAAYVDAGREVRRVSDKQQGETFAAWAERVAGELDTDADVLFQMPLVHDGIRGVADFLERTVDPDTGRVRWEPVDAKLARRAAKPGHVLQLCFYAEALEAATGQAPLRLTVSLGSGECETVDHEAVRPYWSRLRRQLAAVMDTPTGDTRPEPCDHCGFCEFQADCEAVWRAEDSLVFVAGITRAERRALEDAGVTTPAALAGRRDPVEGIRDERLAKLIGQARLQVQAREQPDGPPPFELIAPGDDPVWGRGFERLPAPSDGDVFLDFEGHPFWRPDRGLFFLFGYVARDPDDRWRYHTLWAHDPDEERDIVRRLVHDIRDRRAADPTMHVYHYNHTERSALESLAAEHGVAQRILESLVDAGVFVDLLQVVRNAVQVGVESYGLKHIEVLTGYERSHDIDRGAGAVLAYEAYVADRDEAHLRAIAAYNEDDVRATRAVRDWLVGLRPPDMPWRPEPERDTDEADEIDELIEALAAHGAGTPENLMAGLLGYWRREWRAHIAPILARLDAPVTELLADDTILGGLHDPEEYVRYGRRGRPLRHPGLRLRFPEQALEPAVADAAGSAVFLDGDGLMRFVTVDRVDTDERVVEIVWGDELKEAGHVPTALAPNDWVRPSTKWDVLQQLARQLANPVTHGEVPTLTRRLLEGAGPVFSGDGPPNGAFSDDPAALADLVVQLDESALGVQGPPGTGKTHRGAHMAKALVAAGKRVGVMAMSHHAIDNFLAEMVEVFATEPTVELRAARRVPDEPEVGLPGVTYLTGNTRALASTDHDVVAGTSWMFASKIMRDDPVDVLLVDEAGQLALIDAVVASGAAKSMVLLGDPLQLPQVARAQHPGRSGSSALGHLLGDEVTIPAERGVFISQTRRMHPDVCHFISTRIYQGRLSSHPDCARQSTELGTGLRWIPVDHEGCATESEAEAELVARHVRDLLGRNWTDADGITRPLTAADVMVVAPYNDHVRLLRRRFSAYPAIRTVEVGTVDRFQGRQAAVVFFTMASSSADDMPRGADFLFSRNRLNVAISRARCLAHVVCTERLLDSRARSVDDMLLIATLCAFAEEAERVPDPG